MALPFIAGIALGAGIAFAFTKRDQIAKSLGNLNLDKKIQDGITASKATVTNIKEKVQAKPERKKPGRKPKVKIETQATPNSQDESNLKSATNLNLENSNPRINQ
ncbi:hypothetical protein [Campylobacter devanensis]|uniref:hypothetical protein n=1 Tax=Campylobacter devanensis TaxID=3161138 RepID=UPI000A34AB83|nr:hypothetical protein [Campylobacter sp. P0222]